MSRLARERSKPPRKSLRISRDAGSAPLLPAQQLPPLPVPGRADGCAGPCCSGASRSPGLVGAPNRCCGPTSGATGNASRTASASSSTRRGRNAWWRWPPCRAPPTPSRPASCSPPRCPGAPTRTPQTRIDAWLAALYQDGQRYWAGLQPDRLAEYLIATVLSLPVRCPDLLTGAIKATGQLEQGLTVLGRAAPQHPHLAATIAETLRPPGQPAGIATLSVATRLEHPQPLLDALDSFIAAEGLSTL